jgi:hypothetical protein
MTHPDRWLGTIIDGRYRLSEFIGHGSYGSVFAADEVTMGQVITQVAVKIIAPETDEHRTKILNEILALARLNHDYVIAYRSSGEIRSGTLSSSIFLATELGDTSLGQIVRSREILPDGELRDLVRGVAMALAYIHSQGHLHGDVKPANIIRVKGRWKLGDFGLLRPAHDRSTRNASLTYLAPETLNRELGPANDLYALGVTILNHFTGRYAHSGETRQAFLENLRTEPPNIPPYLRQPWKTLLQNCLQRDPAQRWTSDQIEEFLRPDGAAWNDKGRNKSSVLLAPIIVSQKGEGQFTSIQEAINSAAPGSRILVHPGKYRETLVIDRPLEIIGAGTIDQVVISTHDAHCLEIATDETVLIRGLTLRCRPAEKQEDCYALDFSRGQPVLEECLIRSHSLACVAIHGAARPVLRSCTMFGSADAGVFIYDNGRGEFENCRIAGHGSAGVSIGEGGQGTFLRCEIRDNQAGGVHIFQDGEGRFRECKIIANKRSGVAISPGGKGEFRRCYVRENAGNAIRLHDGALAVVRRCDLSGNQKEPWFIPDNCELHRSDNVE